MSDGYHPPRFSIVFLGLALSAALLVTFLALPAVVKFIGFGLLWLPGKLGMVEQVYPAEVMTFVMADEPIKATFASAGKYAFYTHDPDMLEVTDALMETNNPPWLDVIAPDGGEVSVAYIERGMLPFDSPFAKGRPIYSFLIPVPGEYTLKMPRKLVEVDILPDVVSGREGALWLVLLLELGFLGGLASIPIVRTKKQRAEKIAEIKKLKTVDGDEFWSSVREKKPRAKR